MRKSPNQGGKNEKNGQKLKKNVTNLFFLLYYAKLRETDYIFCFYLFYIMVDFGIILDSCFGHFLKKFPVKHVKIITDSFVIGIDFCY